MTLLLWKCLADQIMWKRGLGCIYRLQDMFAKQLDYITTSPLHIETPKSKENSLLIYRPIWIYTMVQIIVIKVLALISKNSLNWSKFTAKIFMFRFLFQIMTIQRNLKKKLILGLHNIKELLHPKMKSVVINHLPPCRSKPVKALFVFGTQFKVFWMKTGGLVTSHWLSSK